MKKLKVATVIGTRPEIIRLSRVISKLNSSESIEHILIHTGQNYDYELNQVFFDDMDIDKPDYFLSAAGETASQTIGQMLIAVEKVFMEVKPDALLILGDTNSCLAAIPAKKMHIPIFHMEAGNRCFDQRVPEETNRKIVDHISDVNLPYSDIAREYLLREGLPPDRIIKTGSPMYEVLNHYREKINSTQILSVLELKNRNYFLVSSHREENINSENNFRKFIECLNKLAEKYKQPVIVSTHPRTRKMIDLKKIDTNSLVRFIKPLSFTDFNALQINSRVVLSDSGTISEETSILNLRSLNIREAHERPEAMEEATVMMTGFNIDRILQGISQIESNPNEIRIPVADYIKPNVSDKVVKIIISYIDYIKRTVWAE